MLLSKYIFPVYNTPEAGGGAVAQVSPTPTAEPTPASGAQPAAEPEPQEPPDAGFDKILEAFEQDEPDEVDEAPPVPAVEPTPAPPPSPTPAAAPVTASPVAAQPQAVVQTAVPGVAPAPTPAIAPPSPPAQPAVASAPSPAQAPTAPGVVPAAPTPMQNFGEIAEGLKKSKAELIGAVARQNYALSDQDLEEFATDPRKVISQVGASVQIETTASVMKVLAEQLPVVVHQLLEAREQNARAEDAFWAANKHLDRNVHRNETLQTYQQLRALQPNMAQDEAIRQVGQWMAMKHGIAYNPQGSAQPQAPVAPQQVVRTPGPVVRVPVPGGFIPAGPQAAPASSHPQPQKSPFDRFFETMVLDESGAFEE